MNNTSRKTLIAVICATVLLSSQVWASTTIRLGDFSWDSVQLHNRLVGYVLKHGLGFEVQYEFAESLPLLMGMARGDVDASTEIWSDNLKDAWSKMIDEGTAVDLGPTYPDANQGWYVPAYVIKGDPDRGIEPKAPDLKSVFDLIKYKDIFAPRSGGEKDKGRFYNGPTGWVTYTINGVKLKAYGLDEHYENFSSGSSTALAAAIFSAYNRGEPILAYYWEPTPLMGMLDMVQLEEPPYEHKKWDEKTYDGAFPPSRVHIGIGTHLFKKAPQAITILANYSSTLEQTNAALAYMESNKATLDQTVVWFLREYPDQWRRWFPIANDPRIEKVQEALSKEP